MSAWRSTLFPGGRGRNDSLALWRTGLKTGAMTAPATTGLGFGVKRVVEGDFAHGSAAWKAMAQK
ncbi:hypothetical protein M8494_17665 [Serratia ureilytica]